MVLLGALKRLTGQFLVAEDANTSVLDTQKELRSTLTLVLLELPLIGRHDSFSLLSLSPSLLLFSSV